VRWLRALLKECKFFECTAVWPLAHQLAQSMLKTLSNMIACRRRLTPCRPENDASAGREGGETL